MRKLLLVGLLATGFVRAAVPTISCTQLPWVLVFEEGVDSFFVDLTERYEKESLVAQILNREPDHQLYRIQFAIPKVFNNSGPEVPNCRFLEEKPLLFVCPYSVITEKVKVTNTEKGTTEEIAFLSFHLGNNLTSLERLNVYGLAPAHLEEERHVQFRFNGSFGDPMKSKPLSFEIKFPLSACKAGELAETPAR